MTPIAMVSPPKCYATIAAFYAVNRERGPFRTSVLLDGDYAFVAWRGTHSGGEGTFHRRAGRWCVLINGGGALNLDELGRYGVPRPNVERLYAKMQRLFAKER